MALAGLRVRYDARLPTAAQAAAMIWRSSLGATRQPARQGPVRHCRRRARVSPRRSAASDAINRMNAFENCSWARVSGSPSPR